MPSCYYACVAADRRTAILETFAFFREADERLRREIVDSSILASLAAHEFVFREGQSCDKVVFLGRGAVRVFKTSDTGREVTLYRLRPGDACILNIACAVANLDFPADAVAEEAAGAVAVPPKLFLDWMDRFPPVRSFAFRVMSTQFVSLVVRVEQIALARLDRRLAQFLISRSQTHGDVLLLTHEAVAAELGSAREVISRQLKDLERRGMVHLSRGATSVVDEQALLRLGRRSGAAHRTLESAGAQRA